MRFVAIAFITIIIVHSMEAQTPRGAMSGYVIDEGTQEPIVGANLQVVGTSLGASADLNGEFTVSEVPIGTYQLRASAVGYEPALLSDVVVAVGRQTAIRVQLVQVPIGIDEVEVTANLFRKSPDAPVSLQRLSYEEIRRSPGGFEDVIRAVSVLPGVAQAQPGRNDLVVRGGAPSENLFVVDNIEIPNINHFGTQGASGGPLSFINLDFVRETAFSTGGFGVRYGDRLSSVLTIDLAEGRRDRIGGKGTISASQFGLSLQGPAGSNGSFLISARRSYLDLIFRAAGFSFVPEYWDFLGRVHYQLDKSNQLTILGVSAIDDVRFFNDDLDARFENSRILGTDQTQYTIGASWRHLYGNGYSTVTASRTFVKYNGIQNDSLLNPIFTNVSKEVEGNLRADMVVQVSRSTELSFGVQGKVISADADLALPGYVTPFGDTLEVQPVAVTLTGGKGSAYLQIVLRLLPSLQLNAGGRGDYFSAIEKQFSFAPRGALTYDFSNVVSASFTAGQYYQSPSYVWLAANPGNRGLRATRATQFIGGVQYLLRPDLKLRFEGFSKRYSDYPASIKRPYLVLANTGGGFGGSDENFASFGFDDLVSEGFGYASGVEVLLQKKLSEIPLYGILSITLGEARFTALDGVERRGTFDQQVIANLSAGYQFNEEWEASMKFRFSSGKPYTPFNANGTQDVSRYNSAQVENAHSLDLRVDRRWNFSAWNLILYIDIQNVYNNKFTGTVRWNSREQRAETDEDGIGILPTIGVSAEF